jgi:hypothetical protein
MNIAAEIVSGSSIGNIRLETNAIDVLSEIYQEGRIVKEKKFINFNMEFIHYEIDDGVVSIVADENSIIKRLWCKKPYKGKYKSNLFPGMTVSDIKKNSLKQLVIHGFLIPDGDFGIGFNIPDRYDDIDYVDQLPSDLILEELHVMDKEWWR